MATTVTKPQTRRRGTDAAGVPTVRAAIDAFLDTPKVKGTPNTLRAYTNMLDRTAEQKARRRDNTEIDEVLTQLWAGWGLRPGTATAPPLAPG